MIEEEHKKNVSPASDSVNPDQEPLDPPPAEPKEKKDVVFEKPEEGSMIKESKKEETVSEVIEEKPVQPTPKSPAYKPAEVKRTKTKTTRSQEEETEIDPDYKKKKRNKLIALIAGGAALLILLIVLWWNFTHEEVPAFVGENVSNARVWGVENDVELAVEHVFSTEQTENAIISQEPAAGETISKGSTMSLIVSQGPNPDEVLPLPDFSGMSFQEATSWKETNHANNLTITRQYNEDIEADGFIKLDIKDSSVKEDNYQRKHEAILYYSRGEETLEKNIKVPNFTGKALPEVETWANTNQLDLKVTEVTSNSVPAGTIVSQSVATDEMLARKDEFPVQVSVGKALVVPNYADYSQEELALFTDIPTTTLQRYNSSVSYGRLISQSVSPGTEFTEKTVKPVVLTYSLGKPYIDDLRGNQTEGTLQQYFYDTYQSKGADIGYRIYYVDSSSPRGSVVQQNLVGQILPMRAEVSFGISLGNLAAEPTNPTPVNPGGDDNIDDGTGGIDYPGDNDGGK